MDGTVRFVRTLAVFLFFFSYTLAASYSSTAHLTDDYFVIPIDINADEREDTLLQSLTPERESTVSLGNGSDVSTLPLQTLEEIDPDLEWNREHSFLHVGDFNGDGRDDLYLQGRAAGSHQAFVLADPSGRYLSVSEKFSGPHYGFDWSAAVQDVVVGDYDGNGQSELLLRGHDPFDIHLIMRPNRDGILNTTGPSWVDGHLDLPWHTAAAELHPGDFNGDGRTDLVWRSREEGDADPRVAILLASEEGEFTEIAVQGDDDFLDAEWDPATHRILIDDINGDGIDDIVLQARSKTGTNHLVLGDVNGRFEETALSWQGPTSAATAYDQQNSSASINTAGTSTDQKSGDVSMFSMTEPGSGIVGALPGEFSVDPNGASNYRIPIEVPPGVGGMQPDLAFLYSSRAGNGQLGVGWSLSGLSAITRCPKTLAQDDEVGGVQLDGDDRFCLDGQRLMLESGSQYGETGSEYRTEVESFQRITASDESHGSGPESFTVEDKAKLTRYYGKTSNSRILAGGPVLLWAINRIEDPYGNYIAFEYEQDLTAGEYWIKKISWHNANDVTIGEVRFTYSTSRPDTSSGYLPNGDATSLTRRMTQATVYGRAGVHANPGRVRAYRLAYEQGDVTGLSQLTSITQCAHSDSTCLPSTTFEWQQGRNDFYANAALLSTGDIGNNLVHADLDGDGRPDWVYTRNGNWFVRFASKLSVEVATNRAARDADKVIVLDIDGDGRQELLATILYETSPDVSNSYLGGGIVYTGDGEQHSFGMIAPQFPFSSTQLGSAAVSDLDGDGLPEILDGSGGKLVYYQSTGDAFSSSAVNTGFEIDSSQRLIPINFSGSGSGEILVSLGACTNPNPPGGGGGGDDDPPTQENKSSQVSFQKVDTTADATSHCWDTAGVLHWTGDGLERVTSEGFSKFPRPVPLDVNGDGLTDIAYATGNTASDGWYLYVNKGGRFDWAWSDDNGWGYQSDSARVIDYNSDGKTDLLLPLGNGNWHALLSNGETFGGLLDTGIPNTGHATSRVMDLSGNGLADILYRHDGSWWWRRKAGDKPGLMTQATNGLGDIQHITYRSLSTASNDQVYLGHSGTPGPNARHMMGPLHVVRHFAAATGTVNSIGTQNWVITRYRYGGAKMDRHGRGFLGFERIEAHNLNSDIVTVNLHRQDFPFTGMIEKSIQKMPDEVIWESGSTGSTGTGASGGCYDDETGTWILPDGCEPDLFGDFDEPSSFETIPGQKVSETVNTYGDRDLGSSVYPYLKKSVEKHYRHPASTETVYRRVTTDYGDNYDDYGNPLNIVVTTDSGSTGGDAHIVQTVNVYQNDEPSWCLSRLMNSTVTHTRADYGTGNSAPIQEIRNSRFEYQGCRLSLEEVEPNGAADENLVTTYEYDDFGNTALTTTTAAAGNRTTTTVYDALGLFPVRVMNALGHTEQQVWDPRFGKRVSQTGPNGLTTQWEYDAFGRKVLERSPRGTETTRVYRWCSTTDCEQAQAMYAIETERSDGSFTRVEFDMLGREVNKTGIAVVDSVSGIEESIHQATYYDPLGRAYASSQPYFDGDTACWTVRKFDNLGRVTVEASPVGESQCSAAPPAYGASAPSGWSRTDYTYNGLQTTAVVTPDPADLSLQRTTVRTENVAGRLLSVSEAGTSTVYDYDATGNTTWVKAGSNPPTEITYNKRGDKVSMSDPDMGDWSYEYNAFGELKQQTDAVGNMTEMWYDALGRMTKRIDTAAPPDGGSTITEWGYDSGYGAGVGKPAYVVKSDGYLETWAYNDYGQKTDTIKQIDGELFWTSQSYDALGRPDILVYPDVEDFVTDADPTLSNLAITPHEPGRHTVSWDSDADHALYTLYRTRDNDTPDPESDATVVYTGALKSFKDTVHQDGEYRYWVKGCLDDADCDVLGPAAITVTLPPGAPQGVRIEPVVSTDGELAISWNPPIDGGAVSSYQVQERYSANGSSWSNWSSTETVADTVTSGAYTKTSSGYYDYRVQACNAVACSAPVSAYDAARVTLKPPAPGLQVADGLNGNGASPDGQFTLGWNGPPASETVTHYELWEREDSIGSWSRVPDEPLGADREWSPAYDKSDDTLWHYRIRACNDIGCSGDSNTVSVQVLYTPGMPGGIILPVNSGDGNYEVSWGAASGNVDKYELWEAEGPDNSTFSGQTLVYQGSATSKLFSGKVNGAYRYRVRACNVSGTVSECGAYREGPHAIVVLPSPQLSADPPESSGTHELTWTSVPDGTSYRLERQKNNGGWQAPPLYSGVATSYEDSVTLPGLYENDLYQYQVSACLLPAGCGPFSDPRQVSVTNSPRPVITIPSSSTTGDYTVSWTDGSLYNTLEQRKDGGAWVNVPLDNQDATSKTYNDKANGTYEYKVQACNDVNCSNWSDIASITVLKPPVAPALTAPDYNSTGDYIVFWDDPDGAETYELYRDAEPEPIYTGTDTSYPETGRTNGTYSYRVKACNASGCSGLSSPDSTTVELPPPSPTVNAPEVNSTGSFTVSWGGNIRNYLQHRVDGGAWTTLSLGENTLKSFSGLGTGTYDFRAKVCSHTTDNNLCSDYGSVTTTVVTLPPSSAPALEAPPSDNNGAYTVSWATVSTATSYELQRRIDGDNWTDVSNTASTSRSESGLSNGTYDYKVRACNAGGCSAYSAPATTVVTHPPASAPALTTPTSDNNGAYTVSWSSISTATNYQLLRRQDGGAWSTIQNTGVLSKSESGLGNGSYDYKVRACNAGGCSSYSALATTVVTHPPSGAPSMTLPASNNTGDYSVGWSSKATATRYQLIQRKNGGSWTTEYNSSGTLKAFSGQTSGTYDYRVRACNVGGCSSYSPIMTLTVTLPPTSAPTLTAPSSDSNGAYTVSWTSVSGAVSYQLLRRKDGGAWSTVHNDFGTSKSESGLGNGSYDYKVRACNDGGCSSDSAIATTVVLHPPGNTPTLSAPSSDSNGAYTVSWTSVSDAASYQLIRRKNGGSWGTIYNSTGTSKSQSGLGNGTYDYRVRACNSAGCSAYSAIKTTTVLHPPATPSLSAPTSASKYQSFTVSWTSETGAATYQLQRNGSTVQNNSSTNYSNSLNAGTYHYRVRACNASGCSGWSATKTTTVQDTGGCSPSQPWNCEDPQSSPTDPVLFEGMDDGNTSTDPGADDGLTYSREYRNPEGKTRVAVAAEPAAASSAEPLQSQPGVINAASLKTDSRSTVGNFRTMPPQRPGDFYRSLRIGRAPATSRPVAANDDAAVSTGNARNNTHDTTGNMASIQPASAERASRARSVKAFWSPAPVTPLRPDPRINPDVHSEGNHDNLATQSDTKDTGSSFSVQKFGETNEPSGTYAHAVQYHYDARGGLASVSECVDDGGSGCGSGGVVYWQAEVRDAAGSVTQEKLGNGITTVRDIHRVTGALRGIDTFAANGTQIQQQVYEWDLAGNLEAREDLLHDEREEFEYDAQYRLTESRFTTAGITVSTHMQYDANGNLLCKGTESGNCGGDGNIGVHGYQYGGSPHAVTSATVQGTAVSYSYNANGAMVSGAGRTIEWTAFGKPSRIETADASSDFFYGPDRMRYKQVATHSEGTVTTLYIGSLYERITDADGTRHIHYIRAGGSVIAQYTRTDDDTEQTDYWHRDHLGSLSVLTDEAGVLIQRLAFDAWGQRRATIGSGELDWGSSTELRNLVLEYTARGYTGHEQLDHLGLVHMNGRIYDPTIGRFLSADPFVQFPESTQGYNRYTYLGNNPLNATDPSGYFSLKDAVKTAMGVVAMVYMPVIGGAIAGYLATGTGKGALLGGLSGFAAAYIGASYQGLAAAQGGYLTSMQVFEKALTHGLTQGVLSTAGGGRFGDGFLGGFSSSLLGPYLDAAGPVGGTMIAAAVGGTLAKIGGGKFANGATSAAFVHAFNYLAHEGQAGNQGGRIKVETDGAPTGFELAVDEAVKYAADAGESVFSDLESGSRDVLIRYRKDTHSYEFDAENNRHIINWDHRAGTVMAIGRGQMAYQSAALGLIHEAGHAVQVEFNWAATREQMGNSTKLPEGPVISGLETRVAQFYGEPIRDERRSHGGRMKRTRCTTCFFSD